MLEVDELAVKVADKQVLTSFSLKVPDKGVVALIGPNGSGKSSFANTLMGNQNYVVAGTSIIRFDGSDLLQMSVDERSKRGLFVAWQNPIAVPGLSVLSYLRAVYEAHGKKITSMTQFRDQVVEIVKRVGLSEEVIRRNLNDGFSGGERKRFELLQLLLLEPKLVILDEIDSGLDVDGLKLIAKMVEELSLKGTAFVLITHYKRMLEYIKVDSVVVLSSGRIVRRGGMEIVDLIEEKGYGGI